MKHACFFLLFATFGIHWPWRHVSTWEVRVASLANVGVAISGTLVDKVDLEEQRYVQVLNNCYASLLTVVGQYGSTPTVGNLQSVQAMTAAVDREAEHEAVVYIPDKTIVALANLLDQEASEIVYLVPKQDAIQRVLDPERSRWRGSLCQKKSASYFRKRYNLIVAQDNRFTALK